MSYARLDNELPPGMQGGQGFVTHLYNELRHELRALGEPWPELWRDVRHIEPGDQFDGEIKKAIDNSAVLLVVLSRNWLHRPYCLRELEAFAERWKAENPERIRKRIVVVSKHSVRPEDRPALLQGQQGFEFFTLDSDEDAGEEREFFHRGKVRDEARYESQVIKLAKYLWQWERSAPAQTPVVRAAPVPDKAPRPAGRTIYLAKPATDTREAYHRLVQELQRRGYAVVPPVDQAVPPDSAALDFVDTALAEAEASIHLLGASPGFTPEGLDPIVKLQLSRAGARVPADGGERSFRRLVWAPRVWQTDAESTEATPSRDPLAVLASFHRHLPTDTVEGDNLSRFVDVLIQHLDHTAPLIELADAGTTDSRIYLCHRMEDSRYVLDLAKALKQRQVKPVVAALEGDPAEVSADHRRNLQECDAVVLCWASASEVWAKAAARELKNWRELGRSEQFSCRGLVAGPPPGQRKDLFVALADVDEIDVVLDLTGIEHPSPDKLDDLIRRVRPDAS
jgi:hypothetical protein